MSTSRSPSLALALAVCAVAGCGGSTSHSRSTATAATAPSTSSAARRPLRIIASGIGHLPAPLEDPAAAALPSGEVVLLGGLTAADESTAQIVTINGSAAHVRGALPHAQHDAQGALLGSSVFVFGGGDLNQTFDHILRFDPSAGTVREAGAIPRQASDVAVAALGSTAYVVGGYDGSSWLGTIVAFRPGSAPRVVAHLPVGLRYAAVAAADGRLIIAGGTTPTGVSNAVLSFDPASGSLSRIGTLPRPLTHAAAATLAGRVLVIGGRHQVSSGGQSASILAINPATGTMRRVGTLPQPLSDAAAAATHHTVVLAGGSGPAGAQSEILRLAQSG